MVFCDIDLWFLINSVAHHSIHVVRLVRHGHEPVFSFPHAEHCGRRVQVMSRPWPAPTPLHLCLLSILLPPRRHTGILTSQSKQPIALDCPPPPASPLIPVGHSHLLHFVNWSCLLSLAVAPGNGLHVRVECNLRNQSLRLIHPERIYDGTFHKRWTETSSYCFCAAGTEFGCSSQSVERSSIRTCSQIPR